MKFLLLIFILSKPMKNVMPDLEGLFRGVYECIIKDNYIYIRVKTKNFTLVSNESPCVSALSLKWFKGTVLRD